MMNPVLRREAVTSLRGWKNFAVLTFYLGVTALGAGMVIYTGMFDNWDFSFDPQIMMVLYVVLAAVQMALITLTVPALTAGSISGERERQTLDLLLVTKMSSFSIVMGKLLASLAFILLLIVGTLPVLSPGSSSPDAFHAQVHGRVQSSLETDVWKLEQTKRSEEYKF